MLRPMRPADVPAVVALINRGYRHDGVPMAKREEEFVEELAADEVSYDDDVRVAVRGDRIVGWTHTLLLPSEVGQQRCYLDGEVDPDERGTGIGSALLGWAASRGREQLLGLSGDLPRYLRCSALATQADRRALLEDHGFAVARWFEDLARPLVDLPPVRVPPGIELLPWPEASGDAEVLRVRNEAFADHWGSAPVAPKAWTFMTRGFGARPDLSLVARDTATGAVVGFSLNHRYEEDDAVVGRKEGWIEGLGTLRAYRGRGIATALLARSLHLFAEAGLSHALIGVDSASPTGAHRLYRAVGFEMQLQTVMYQQEIST